MKDRKILVGGNDIDAIRFDPQTVLDLNDLHRCGACEQLDQHAFVSRVQMLNDDETESTFLRHVAQKGLERFQTARRGPNAYNGERRSCTADWISG